MNARTVSIFAAGFLLAAALFLAKDAMEAAVAAPTTASAPAASQPTTRLAGTDSPHGLALALVLATQQKAIREMEKKAGTLGENAQEEKWWHDVTPRTWSVVRPCYPGVIDSTHWFVVRYSIDGKEVGSWNVDTRGGKVAASGPGDFTLTPADTGGVQLIDPLKAK
jgi:hypothetical protein